MEFSKSRSWINLSPMVNVFEDSGSHHLACGRAFAPRLPELENDSGERNESTEKFAGQFDAGILGGHRRLRHVELFLTEKVSPNPGAARRHFDEAGHDGEDKIPCWQLAERDHNKCDSDNEIEEEPQGRIKRGRVCVDLGVDVISLEPGEDDENESEGVVEKLHLVGDCSLLVYVKRVTTFHVEGRTKGLVCLHWKYLP